MTSPPDMSNKSYEDQLSDSSLFASEEEESAATDSDALDESNEYEDSPEPESYDDSEPEYADWIPAKVRGSAWWMLGAVIALAGITLGVIAATGEADAMPWLMTSGITQGTLFVTGVLLVVTGSIIRANDQSANFVASEIAPLHELVSSVHTRLDGTIGYEQFAQVPAQLNRLDEKISNLSRATKMYGKPLLDVANRMQQAANHLTEIERSLDGVVEQVKSSGARLGDDVGKLMAAVDRADPFPKEEIDRLLAASKRSAELVEELREEIVTKPDSDAEWRPSLDAMQGTLDTIRTEIQSLSSAVSSIRSLPASPQSASRPAPSTTPAAPATPATPAPNAAGNESPASGNGGLANSIAGERKSKGKNVLGAIAKLKQMRN
ncbi:MAG: hypothetical protein KDB80_06550 [Planctomycetes bacterium]|nr:hypothetical protein [Planctomycetota bacterium]